jgi:hypothetical protein
MNQKYTPIGDKLVPFPIMEKPREINFHGIASNLHYLDAFEAYNQWLSIPQPLILPEYEKDFKSKPVFEEGIDFRIEKGRQFLFTDQQQWQQMSKEEKDTYFELVAIPIVKEEGRGITIVRDEDSKNKTKYMKSGIELIAEERQEQIKKHGRTLEKDIVQNDKGQLMQGASLLLQKQEGSPFDDGSNGLDHCFRDLLPEGWDRQIYHKMFDKPYKERLIIAGALIAAEIDRLNQTKVG